MDPLNRFVLTEKRAVFCPAGSLSFNEVVGLVESAIAVARQKQAEELLVDTRELTGFPVPSEFQRFLAAVNWAEMAKGTLRLAMIARPEMIHPLKYGVVVAATRSLVSNIFSTAAEARAWLDAAAEEARRERQAN